MAPLRLLRLNPPSFNHPNDQGFTSSQILSSQESNTQKPRKSLPNGPVNGRPFVPLPSQAIKLDPADSERFCQRSMSPSNRRSTSYKVSPNYPNRHEVSSPPAEQRSAKDEFLIQARREGMSYKDIKVQGNFAEAESTLRGRYRMLTKSKEERVRNPKWTDVDEMLLCKAVNMVCHGRDPATVKIPWKEIAKYIIENGGSYHFGNATCRKKWDELVMEDEGEAEEYEYDSEE